MDSNFCPESGKQMFLTHYQAERVLRGLNIRTHTAIDYGSIYRCDFCHHWHITHYGYEERDSMNSARGKPPNKKLLRSERNREKRYYKERKQLLPVFYDIMIIERRIIPLVPGTDLAVAAQRISEAAGQIKTFCAAPNAIAQLLMRDAYHQLVTHKCIRHESKKLFALAMEQLQVYCRGLIHPVSTPLPLFDVQTMSEQYRSRYQKNLTTQQYVEFWEGVGGEVYDVIKPQLKVLTYKYERYYERISHPFPHEMALAHLASTMLSLAKGTFDTVLRYSEQYTPQLNIPLRQLMSQCDMEEVYKAWNRATDYIDKKDSQPTPDEERNVDLTMQDIIKVLSDPEQIILHAQDAIRDFGTETFANKKEIKLALARNYEVIENCRREHKEKILKTLDKNGKN